MEIAKSNVNTNRVVGAAESSTEFTLKAGPELMRILSSSLYSDKIGAVVRELICNARDAWVEAGRNGDVAFKVGVENGVYFIRDYGTGLDHDRLVKLFTTYGESTKSAENNSIGGFGVGSKSPFAYTQEFTVVSYFEGQSRMYQAILGTNGIPTLTYLGGGPTSEPNGLHFQVPLVAASDERTFRHRAEYLCSVLGVPSVCFGEECKSIDLLTDLCTPLTFLEGAGVFNYAQLITKMQPHGRGREYIGRVFVGGVGYDVEIPTAKLQNLIPHTASPNFDILSYLEISLVLPIGSVDINVSRERLDLTNKTIDVIKNAILEIQDMERKKFVDLYAPLKNKSLFPLLCLRFFPSKGNLLSEFWRLPSFREGEFSFIPSWDVMTYSNMGQTKLEKPTIDTTKWCLSSIGIEDLHSQRIWVIKDAEVKGFNRRFAAGVLKHPVPKTDVGEDTIPNMLGSNFSHFGFREKGTSGELITDKSTPSQIVLNEVTSGRLATRAEYLEQISWLEEAIALFPRRFLWLTDIVEANKTVVDTPIRSGATPRAKKQEVTVRTFRAQEARANRDRAKTTSSVVMEVSKINFQDYLGVLVAHDNTAQFVMRIPMSEIFRVPVGYNDVGKKGRFAGQGNVLVISAADYFRFEEVFEPHLMVTKWKALFTDPNGPSQEAIEWLNTIHASYLSSAHPLAKIADMWDKHVLSENNIEEEINEEKNRLIYFKNEAARFGLTLNSGQITALKDKEKKQIDKLRQSMVKYDPAMAAQILDDYDILSEFNKPT